MKPCISPNINTTPNQELLTAYTNAVTTAYSYVSGQNSNADVNVALYVSNGNLVQTQYHLINYSIIGGNTVSSTQFNYSPSTTNKQSGERGENTNIVENASVLANEMAIQSTIQLQKYTGESRGTVYVRVNSPISTPEVTRSTYTF